MTRFSRRDLLRAAPALLAPTHSLPSSAKQPVRFKSYPFTLGVASGDPTSDGFVIWTRLAPDPLVAGHGMPDQPIVVRWEVAGDERFDSVVRQGDAIAHPVLAHSVHVEISGLASGRPYWYRFVAGGERSGVGRAVTTPALNADVASIRLAVIGCQHYEHGYFSAHHWMTRDAPDLIFCYGDYIYEDGAAEVVFDRPSGTRLATVRQHAGGQCYSLDEYRARYAQYKSDKNLQTAHAWAPWICTWDDHEVANNWTGDSAADGTPSEIFLLRRAAAAQAMYEHLPLRRSAFPGHSMRLFRSMRWGNLLDLYALDTRLYRDAFACGGKSARPCEEAYQAQRSMIGQAQEAWLAEEFGKPAARWSALAQQVMMMTLDQSKDADPLWNMDTWAGYPAARDRVLDLAASRRRKLIVLTGDAHQNHVGEVRRQRISSDLPPDAVEFVATSATSGGEGGDTRDGNERVLARNPHCKFLDDHRGYLICDVTRAEWRTSLRVLSSVRDPESEISTRVVFGISDDLQIARV